MRRAVFLVGAALCFAPGLAGAVTEQTFVAKTARELVEVCATSQSDPLYTAAINFCQGFVVGAYAYHRALYADDKHKDPICLPDPRLPRLEVIADFVAWAKENPKYDEERAVEALGKFMIEKWPCPEAPPPAKAHKGKAKH